MSSTHEKLPAELLLPRGNKRRRIFFAGKGGVGKTTMACTSALYVANQGVKTLLVTTDPASHIGQVFGQTVTARPSHVLGTNLWLVRIDPKAAFAAYHQKVIAALEEQFGDPATVERVSEELNSPCTEEVAVFQEFLDYLLRDTYEVTVFDTAPTGHTIRLLQLSWEYETELENKEAFTAETAALDTKQLSRMSEAIRTLQDRDETGMCFVTLPESTPIAEMQRAIADLARTQIDTQAIIVNQVLPEEAATSRLFGKRLAIQIGHIQDLIQANPNPVVAVAMLQDDEIIGIGSITRFSEQVIEPIKEVIV